MSSRSKDATRWRRCWLRTSPSHSASPWLQPSQTSICPQKPQQVHNFFGLYGRPYRSTSCAHTATVYDCPWAASGTAVAPTNLLVCTMGHVLWGHCYCPCTCGSCAGIERNSVWHSPTGSHPHALPFQGRTASRCPAPCLPRPRTPSFRYDLEYSQLFSPNLAWITPVDPA